MCFAITCKTHFLQENDMRIDKFLKNSRLIKRRTVAKDACDQGRVFINDKVAKAGSEVNVGDTIPDFREIFLFDESSEKTYQFVTFRQTSYLINGQGACYQYHYSIHDHCENNRKSTADEIALNYQHQHLVAD